jgi:DNA repair exonuclease SbcCD ATPase subunit
MTDAAVPITQSAVERFAEQYLGSFGSTIEKHGDRWEVTVPESASTGLASGHLTLFCDDPGADLGENERHLHPESPLFQEIIAEASEKQPTGKITIESEDTQVETPRWLREGNVTVNDATFTPYYDRSAIAILYRVSIETVSEYQSELLRVTAVDIRSKERLPKLEKKFLESTLPAESQVESQSMDIEASTADKLITHSRDQIVERVQPRVDEIHQEASRAADAEIEEYRQMQQQRIEQLEEEKTRLSDRVNDLSDLIQQSSDENDRIEALQKRKELNSEYEDVGSELEKLRHRRDQGFPEKQREIRERHALEVVVSPLSVTQIEYERGEIEIELSEEATTQSLTLGYGEGIGITEELSCDVCGQSINAQNPLRTIRQGTQCSHCPSD